MRRGVERLVEAVSLALSGHHPTSRESSMIAGVRVDGRVRRRCTPASRVRDRHDRDASPPLIAYDACAVIREGETRAPRAIARRGTRLFVDGMPEKSLPPGNEDGPQVQRVGVSTACSGPSPSYGSHETPTDRASLIAKPIPPSDQGPFDPPCRPEMARHAPRPERSGPRFRSRAYFSSVDRRVHRE